jgi:hypothetical protein
MRRKRSSTVVRQNQRATKRHSVAESQTKKRGVGSQEKGAATHAMDAGFLTAKLREVAPKEGNIVGSDGRKFAAVICDL